MGNKYAFLATGISILQMQSHVLLMSLHSLTMLLNSASQVLMPPTC